MATAVQLYSGADAVRAAEKLRQEKEKHDNWPYEHCFPPPNSIPVNAIGSIATGALASVVVPLTYKVPSGYRFIMTAIVQDYTGGAFTPGAALWTVDLNTPVGIPSVQAAPVQGLVAVPVRLGSFDLAQQWEFQRAYEFAPLDILRSKVTNVGLSVGTPNFFSSGFFGWLVPSVK